MSLNVLVVDDSSVGRMVIAKALRLSGVDIGDVHQAGDGKQGLTVLEENWVDVVFADINMPVMNGEEMIDRIRDNPTWADMPIVVVSTEGSKTRIERLERKGARSIDCPGTIQLVGISKADMIAFVMREVKVVSTQRFFDPIRNGNQ